MKVITILGSPKINGNTETVLEWVEAELKNHGHEIDRVNVNQYDLDGCVECFLCRESAELEGCVVKDDVDRILTRMVESDAIVLASPLFCWGFTAQIKPIIDRSVCMVEGYGGEKHTSLIEGKNIGLLVTCGGPIEGNADIIQTVFERYAKYTRTHVAGKCIIPGCTTPDELGDDAKEKAKMFASEIVAQV